jgi:hypothetical protein
MLKPKMKLKHISDAKIPEMKSAATALNAKRRSPIEMVKAVKSKMSKGYR